MRVSISKALPVVHVACLPVAVSAVPPIGMKCLKLTKCANGEPSRCVLAFVTSVPSILNRK